VKFLKLIRNFADEHYDFYKKGTKIKKDSKKKKVDTFVKYFNGRIKNLSYTKKIRIK
jgi:hypothetical protein